MMDISVNIVCDAALRGQAPTLIVNELQLLITDLADMTHDCNFHQVLTSHVIVSSIDASLSGHVQLRKAAPINFMTLTAWWMIAPERAKKTVQLTTQWGVCTCLNSTLARRFPTNDRMLCYKRLPHTTFTDTLFGGTPSRSGNKCAQDSPHVTKDETQLEASSNTCYLLVGGKSNGLTAKSGPSTTFVFSYAVTKNCVITVL